MNAMYMSWATCYSGSNNIHFDFPPLMADGRNYASWQPEAVVNQRIQHRENIRSNWEYRQFMTQRGLEIMQVNTLEACEALGLSVHEPTAGGSTPASNVPLLLASNYDKARPGFGYNESDLKKPYLSREQLNARLIAPVVTVPLKRTEVAPSEN